MLEANLLPKLIVSAVRTLPLSRAVSLEPLQRQLLHAELAARELAASRRPPPAAYLQAAAAGNLPGVEHMKRRRGGMGVGVDMGRMSTLYFDGRVEPATLPVITAQICSAYCVLRTAYYLLLTTYYTHYLYYYRYFL